MLNSMQRHQQLRNDVVVAYVIPARGSTVKRRLPLHVQPCYSTPSEIWPYSLNDVTVCCIYIPKLLLASISLFVRPSGWLRGRGATGSSGSVDPPPPLFRVRGPHAAFDPHFLSAIPTLTPTFRYPSRPLVWLSVSL